VLVIEGGRIVEDGPPSHLASSASRYRELLDAEEAVRTGMWKGKHWRHIRMNDGRVEPGGPKQGHREERGDRALAWRTSNRRNEPTRPALKTGQRTA
jgi:hypothetical protein